MNRVILITLFVIISTISSKAQIYIGPKGGLNLTNMSDGRDRPEGIKEPFKIGFNAGVQGQADIDRFFSLYADLGYSLKGNAIKYVEEDETVRFSYHYVQLAVLPRFVYDQDIIRYYLNAGPTLGWLIGGSANFMGENVKIEFVDTDEYVPQAKQFQFLKDNTNRLEASLSLGGGIIVDAGKGAFTVDLRYDWGLTNIREDYDSKGVKLKNKNNVISISLGYLFELQTR